MHQSNIRHRQSVFRLQALKIFLFSILFFILYFPKCDAQFSIMEHDEQNMNRMFHFGVALGYNLSNYKITLDSNFISQKTILNVQPVKGPGFNLGIVSDLHLAKYWELRFIPALSFAEKDIQYTRKDSVVMKKIESVYLEFPLLLKYKSKPYNNMRMYVIGGLKYSIDMQSNALARKAENLIKVKQNDYSIDYGIGMELHLPLVVMAPEIKWSYGIVNILQNDDKLIYSSVLNRLRSRCILFTIHLEG
ncbi:MAG TPA: hypothetical protein DCQ93_07275 [Bacteroidetes bacterium]|nr:hypothetical protein [Bacteroidota bacterium]